MKDALHLMADREYDVDSHQVLRLVTLSTCSAHDCEFVALAQELGASLVTMDKQILNDFPWLSPSKPFSALQCKMAHPRMRPTGFAPLRSASPAANAAVRRFSCTN